MVSNSVLTTERRGLFEDQCVGRNRIGVTASGEIFQWRDRNNPEVSVLIKRFFAEEGLQSDLERQRWRQELCLLDHLSALKHPLLPIIRCWRSADGLQYAAFVIPEGTLLPKLVGSSRVHSDVRQLAVWGLQLIQLIDLRREAPYPHLYLTLQPDAVLVTEDSGMVVLPSGIESVFGGVSKNPPFVLLEGANVNEPRWRIAETRSLAGLLIYVMTAGRERAWDGDGVFSGVALHDVVAPPACGPLLLSCMEALRAESVETPQGIRRALRQLVGEGSDDMGEAGWSVSGRSDAKEKVRLSINVRRMEGEFLAREVLSEGFAKVHSFWKGLRENILPQLPLFLQSLLRRAQDLLYPVTEERLVFFTRQLSQSIRSGISLLKTFSLLMEDEDNRQFMEVLVQVQTSLTVGKRLSEALAQYPSLFSPMVVKLVAAGEEGGVLATTLEDLANTQEEMLRVRKSIKTALIYPSMLACISIGSMYFLFGYLIPRLFSIISEMNVTLPWTSRALMAISQSLFNPVTQGTILLVVVLAALCIKNKRRAVKEYFDSLLLSVPIVKKVIVKFLFAHFLRTAGLLCRCGVPLLHAFHLADAVCDNSRFRREFTNPLLMGLRQGTSLFECFRTSPLTPPLVTALVQVGTEAGNFPEMLLRLADLFRDELLYQLEIVSQKLTPIIMLVVGAVMTVILVSAYVPLYSVIHNLGS